MNLSHSLIYYSELTLTVILTVTLFVSIKHRKKYPLLRFFPIYIGLLLLIYLAGVISEEFLHHGDKKIQHLIEISLTFLDYLFTLIEFLIFSNFFITVLKSSRMKAVIRVLACAFICYYVYALSMDPKFPSWINEFTQSRVYTAEAIILFFPCIYYFWELFKHLHINNLKNEPSFWITTGLFFFISVTSPYSIIENYLRKTNLQLLEKLYPLFYVFYACLFFMIIKAYCCKPRFFTSNSIAKIN